MITVGTAVAVASSCCCSSTSASFSSSSRALVIVSLASCLFLANAIQARATPLSSNSQPRDKKFWTELPFVQPSARQWAPAARSVPILMPYSNGNGFVSAFPSGLSDRWADQQFAGGANKRTPEEAHFMEPGWLGLGEPGRLEWNFNRLR